MFLRRLPPELRGKCIDYLDRVRQHGTRLPRNIVAHIEDALWEVRPEYGGIEYRFFFFVQDDERIGVVSAIVKKRQRVERRVIEYARLLIDEMRREWRRVDDGPA